MATSEPYDPPVVEEWTEVRLTGQPNGTLADRPFPPYDFTFRSDRETWEKGPPLIALARECWDNVTVSTRRVRVTTETSPWKEGEPWTGG